MTRANARASSLRNIEDAKQCLRLIGDIAGRAASSWNPEHVGYALQELSQVLLERTGIHDRIFEPVPAGELGDLSNLLEELAFIHNGAEGMAVADLN
jgi:hypothetical protein